MVQCLSVCLSQYVPQQQMPQWQTLLLLVQWVGDTVQQGRVVGAQQHGVRQQMQAVWCWDLRYEDQHRLVCQKLLVLPLRSFTDDHTDCCPDTSQSVVISRDRQMASWMSLYVPGICPFLSILRVSIFVIVPTELGRGVGGKNLELYEACRGWIEWAAEESTQCNKLPWYSSQFYWCSY